MPDLYGITISGGKVFLLTFMIKEFWMTEPLNNPRMGKWVFLLKITFKLRHQVVSH